MGWIDIIKSLSTVPSRGVNKSHQHQEKNSCECWDSNLGVRIEPGAAGWVTSLLLLCYAARPDNNSYVLSTFLARVSLAAIAKVPTFASTRWKKSCPGSHGSKKPPFIHFLMQIETWWSLALQQRWLYRNIGHPWNRSRRFPQQVSEAKKYLNKK